MLGKTALLLIFLFGTVVHHGSVFVDNSHYHVVTIYPSDELITKALSSDKLVVGFSSCSNGYLILEFNVSRGNYVLKYYVSKVTFDNPLKMNIYLKKDGKWVLLKKDVASVGWHVVPIPNVCGTIFVKFESCGPVEHGAGASFINYIRLEPMKSSSFVDLKTMQFYISGKWYPLAVLVLVVIACFFGSCTLSTTKFSLTVAGALSSLLLAFTFLGVNIYLLYYIYPSSFSLIVSALTYSVIAAFAVSKLVNQFSKDAKH